MYALNVPFYILFDRKNNDFKTIFYHFLFVREQYPVLDSKLLTD